MFEVDLYQTRHILILRLPKPEDFHVYQTLKYKTKAAAMAAVKGNNASMECVDCPYQPIRVYQILKGKRKLIWSQGWDDVYGNVVEPTHGEA
jgi:hypothetical protein